MRVLGIMSGTSIDSVDYAVCSISDEGKIALEDYAQAAFPPKLKSRLHALARNESTVYEVAQLHHDLGRFYAKTAQKTKHLDLVGLHGQTIFHNPEPPAPATLQIGEPAYLAESLGVPVISNFRAADIAAGGQGAPLATVFHASVFSLRGEHVTVNNLGGISNVTSLDWSQPSSPEPGVISFDTGPANMLMDMAARRFSEGKLEMDRDGGWAKRGSVCEALLEQWLSHPYFAKAPPKSTGRELFGEPFFERALSDAEQHRLLPADILATFTEFTAASISESYKRHLPSIPGRVILCGGGAGNSWLVARIRERLRDLSLDAGIITSDQLGWPEQSIEPAAFALLAWLRWMNKPGNLPRTTGAKHPCVLGKITAAQTH